MAGGGRGEGRGGEGRGGEMDGYIENKNYRKPTNFELEISQLDGYECLFVVFVGIMRKSECHQDSLPESSIISSLCGLVKPKTAFCLRTNETAVALDHYFRLGVTAPEPSRTEPVPVTAPQVKAETG